MSESKFKTSATIFAKGMCMGAADIVPGVSGGTIALILGIYARFVAGLKSINLAFFFPMLGWLASLITLRPKQTRTEHYNGLVKALGTIDLPFLLPLGLGMITALGIGSKVIPDLMINHPAPTFAFFCGLIAYSIRIPFKLMGSDKKKLVVRVPVIVLAAVLSYMFVGLQISAQPQKTAMKQNTATASAANFHSPKALGYVFASGMIAISAMILPGVSGSFMLLFLGQYRPVLEALNMNVKQSYQLVLAIFTRADFFALADQTRLFFLLAFMLGLLFGLAFFSRIMTWLLKHFYGLTMAALTGLMAGSLRLPIWEIMRTDIRNNTSTLLLTIICLLAGIATIYILERKGKNITKC